MSKDELIDSHVSERQCKLAVEALLKHELKRWQEKQEDELLPAKEPHVWLVVTVKTIHPKVKIKPYKIPIVHPIVDPRTSAVCLITKDPQRQYKDLLESHGIKFISRVVGITKLKGKFKPFEARRLLLKENEMFLADERVIPLLPPLLGAKWFEAKKQPIPVCLTKNDLKGELERAISSTYMHQNQGTCTAIKISTISQTPSQILANLKSALPAIVKNIKGQWGNILNIHIKTNSSMSLPIWVCSLDESEEGRWGGSSTVAVTKTSPEKNEGSDEAEESGSPKPQEDKVATKKRKKRLPDDPTPLAPSSPKKQRKAPALTSPSSTPRSDRDKPPPKVALKEGSLKTKDSKTVGHETWPPTTLHSASRSILHKDKKLKYPTKKEKMMRWMVGKSAKQYLLGRKVAQS